MKKYLTTREFHTVLAALRLWQFARSDPSPMGTMVDKHLLETIATNNQRENPLSPDEIGRLCERLNTTSIPFTARKK